MQRPIKGKRIDLHDGDIIPEGAYGKDQRGLWYGKPPGFKSGYANLSKHQVQEHKDGSVSVRPSIKVTNHVNQWHGYLIKGKWSEC